MKKGIAFYLSAVAAVLGAIGVALAAYSSMISTDNALANMPLVIGAGVVGVVLVIAAMLAPASMGDHNPVTAIGVMAAIALFSYVYGQCLLQRIMLIAGLFSYNAGNTVGWNIFYVVVGCTVCLVVACVLLIISSFCNSTKAAAEKPAA